jgi:hypothetical protein
MKDIVNIKQDKNYTLYMGRANKWLGLEQSKWHNPFPMKAERERPKCLYDFVGYIINNGSLLSCLPELKDQICGCYCRPKVCHCDVLSYLFYKEFGELDLRTLHAKCSPDTLFKFLTDWRDTSDI